MLHSFFHRGRIPTRLLHCGRLFTCRSIRGRGNLNSSFSAEVLAQVREPIMGTRHLAVHAHFVPLFGTTTVVTILFLVNAIVRRTVRNNSDSAMSMRSRCRSSAASPRITCRPMLPASAIAGVATSSANAKAKGAG